MTNSETFGYSWRRGVNAGGRPNLQNTFWTNTQYLVQFTEEAANGLENKCTLDIKLEQNVRGSQEELLSIGFILYKVPPSTDSSVPKSFFANPKWVDRIDSFSNDKFVQKTFRLPLGSYIVIPCTFEANQQGDYEITFGFENSSFECRQLYSKLDLSFTGQKTASRKQGKLQTPKSKNKDYGDGGGCFSCMGSRSSNAKERYGEGSAPPAKYDPEVKVSLPVVVKMFNQIAGPNALIDAYQLLKLLQNALKDRPKFTGIEIDTCKSLCARFSQDSHYMLSQENWAVVWANILTWTKEFQRYDRDRSGAIDVNELQSIITETTKIKMTNELNEMLVYRFGDEEGRIVYNEFIHMRTVLSMVLGIYTKSFTSGTTLDVTLNELLDLIVMK